MLLGVSFNHKVQGYRRTDGIIMTPIADHTACSIIVIVIIIIIIIILSLDANRLAEASRRYDRPPERFIIHQLQDLSC